MDNFIPPFCPYKECECHTFPNPAKWWIDYGSHKTKLFDKVHRFRCKKCKRTFSSQTFSLDYFVKRLIDFHKVEYLISSSMSIRALSRELSCSCDSVLNRIDRLSRQGIALHSYLRRLAKPREAICFDGLVSFDRSQYFPNDIGLSITAQSRFILGMTHVTTKRSGCQTAKQKEKSKILYKKLTFERKGIDRSFREHLDLLKAERPIERSQPLIIITDEKKEYRRVFLKHPLIMKQTQNHPCGQLRINSKLPRNYANRLFASNYLDREIRKDQAQHRRETTCFCQNVANGMNRLSTFAVYHNYQKRYLINWPVHKKESHARMAGIKEKLIQKAREKMFRQRSFLSQLTLREMDKKIWTKSFYSPEKAKIIYSRLPNYAFD